MLMSIRLSVSILGALFVVSIKSMTLKARHFDILFSEI